MAEDSWLKKLFSNSQLMAENARLRAEAAKWAGFHPPGHFYSPLHSREESAEAFARGGWTVTYKVEGTLSGTSKWTVKRKKVNAKNALAKKLRARCA